MFRKALFPLLCAATFAAAIPLKMGESWVWQVTNRNNMDLTYRSVTVIDSQSVTQGKVWTLLARDSMQGSQDTAKIFVSDKGHQRWLRGSMLLSWEPGPYSKQDSDVVIVGNDTSRHWGEAGFARGIDCSSYLKINPSAATTKSVCRSGMDGSVIPENSFLPSMPEKSYSQPHNMFGAIPSELNAQSCSLSPHLMIAFLQ
ncbi:MAG: hypothetical protein IPN71_17065 [Fibrobacteres bacterium]|nr:hypothetical protein [Fibrobacterota bacterium]